MIVPSVVAAYWRIDAKTTSAGTITLRWVPAYNVGLKMAAFRRDPLVTEVILNAEEAPGL